MQLLIVISSTRPFVLWKSGHYFLKLSYSHLGVHANSMDHLELYPLAFFLRYFADAQSVYCPLGGTQLTVFW